MAEDPLKQPAARIFLAIPLGNIFHRDIEGLLGRLRSQVPAVRWVKPDQVHITLYFFGSVPVPEIELIDLASKKVAALFSPLKLSLGCFGVFPHPAKPNIVWLEVLEDSGRLLSLQKAIQGEMHSLGFEIEARAFLPHATLGRVKWKSSDLGPLLKENPFPSPVPWHIADRFVLYQSHCLPEGVRYEILKTYPLSKKA